MSHHTVSAFPSSDHIHLLMPSYYRHPYISYTDFLACDTFSYEQADHIFFHDSSQFITGFTNQIGIMKNLTLFEYIKLDRDKSTFKSHRDFSSEKEISFKHF